MNKPTCFDCDTPLTKEEEREHATLCGRCAEKDTPGPTRR